MKKQILIFLFVIATGTAMGQSKAQDCRTEIHTAYLYGNHYVIITNKTGECASYHIVLSNGNSNKESPVIPAHATYYAGFSAVLSDGASVSVTPTTASPANDCHGSGTLTVHF